MATPEPAAVETPVVSTIMIEVVDPTRVTDSVTDDARDAPERRLPTTVRLPARSTPAPLIMFSHGLGGHPDLFDELFDAWAKAGYVVAAPRFPLTSSDNPGHGIDVGDLSQQPADITAVIDTLLAASAADTGPLAGRIDPLRVGAAGFSLGGATTYALAYNDCCRDDRVSAVVLLGTAVIIYDGTNDFSRPLPVLVVHGDADQRLDISLATNAWAELAGPGYFVTLLGAPHAPPYEDPPSPWDAVVMSSTTAFWDLTLGGDPAAAGRLEDAVAAQDAVAQLAIK
jgi:predicted dienelactone hydrolase